MERVTCCDGADSMLQFWLKGEMIG
jgi:hypothetical protein